MKVNKVNKDKDKEDNNEHCNPLQTMVMAKSNFWNLHHFIFQIPVWNLISEGKGCVWAGLHNMRHPGSLAARHFFFPRHFYLQRRKMPGELTSEKNVKCLGKCGSKWHFLPGTFFENIKCAWEHADATNPSFPGTSYGKSAMICFC